MAGTLLEKSILGMKSVIFVTISFCPITKAVLRASTALAPHPLLRSIREIGSPSVRSILTVSFRRYLIRDVVRLDQSRMSSSRSKQI